MWRLLDGIDERGGCISVPPNVHIRPGTCPSLWSSIVVVGVPSGTVVVGDCDPGLCRRLYRSTLESDLLGSRLVLDIHLV